MQASEIWETIVKADELLKYAAGEHAAQRRDKAKQLLEDALSEAEAASNEALAEQARTRLRDLDADA